MSPDFQSICTISVHSFKWKVKDDIPRLLSLVRDSSKCGSALMMPDCHSAYLGLVV
jgi:hypothetical protein